MKCFVLAPNNYESQSEVERPAWGRQIEIT